MNAINAARRIVLADPTSQESRVLVRLVLALGNETPFEINDLYDLDLKTFDLAIQILQLEGMFGP